MTVRWFLLPFSFKELNYEPGTIGDYFYAVHNCALRYKIKHYTFFIGTI